MMGWIIWVCRGLLLQQAALEFHYSTSAPNGLNCARESQAFPKHFLSANGISLQRL